LTPPRHSVIIGIGTYLTIKTWLELHPIACYTYASSSCNSGHHLKGVLMDMSEFNEDIKNAEDQPKSDGPNFPDGEYVLTVTGHEDKEKDPIPNSNPTDFYQKGLQVTFKICEGKYKGRDYQCYYGLKHRYSEIHVKLGHAEIKKLYKATINAMPAQFSAVYGKRFLAQFESTEQPDNNKYPWSTKIIEYTPAPAEKMQSFDDKSKDVTFDTIQAQPTAEQKEAAKKEIDEIPF